MKPQRTITRAFAHIHTASTVMVRVRRRRAQPLGVEDLARGAAIEIDSLASHEQQARLNEQIALGNQGRGQR